jgi:hypothetical protein
MEPHAVPRQITTFEFKLIGFLTLKEFAYLIVFAGLAAVAYFTAPFDLAKYASAGAVFGVGVFLAFFKYNERSIDVWVKNLAVKLFSSSQYYYHKREEPPAYLRDMPYDKQVAVLHVDAQKKLSSYEQRASTTNLPPTPPVAEQPTPTSSETVSQPERDLSTSPPTHLEMANEAPLQDTAPKPAATTPAPASTPPSFYGIVKNNKDLPLPNILVYVKNRNGQVARILKTNSHGIFTTNRPFDKETYVLEPKDTGNRFFFDTMNVDPTAISQPLVIRSKEAL